VPAGGTLLLVLLVVLLWAPASAGASRAYVTGRDGTLSEIDTSADRNFGTIEVGKSPIGVAITPDGRFAYVLDEDESVYVVDLQNGFVSSPITVGGKPQGVAITPDGSQAYVTTDEPGQLLAIETATDKVVGGKIEICAEPQGVAISPDGRYAYVACDGKGKVWVIETQTGERVGEPISVGEKAESVAIAPDGSRAYVTDPEGGRVAVIDTATKFLGSPIPAPRPFGLAISPDGGTGYVVGGSPAQASAFSLASGLPLASTPEVEGVFESAALTPDGAELLAPDIVTGDVSIYDARTLQPTSQPIPVGEEPHALAIVPDQAPHAAFSVPDGRPGLPLGFDASASSDPDGSIARYAWSFGDGATATGGPLVKHTYKRPGDYRVTLTLTDNEGCSTALVFTGATASCNGSPSASQTQAVKVSYPGVRVKCPQSAGRSGCHLKLQAVTRRRRGKAESTAAKVHVKAGGRTIVPLRFKPAFARRLAAAKRALVRERLSIGGHARTRTVELKIVR
jgi:YVTN family beta-propeller protein